MPDRITRRQALVTAGAAGAAVLGARAGMPGSLGAIAPAAAAATGCATLTPTMTEGPYWLDLALRRSSIIANTADAPVSPGVAQTGVPLALTINVIDAAEGCTPLNDAHVDIWHANAYGLYSDERSQMTGGGTSTTNTAGEDFLRGYQITGSEGGADGQVKFKTIWPGWYTGRAIHIHVRVRTYDSDRTPFVGPPRVRVGGGGYGSRSKVAAGAVGPDTPRLGGEGLGWATVVAEPARVARRRSDDGRGALTAAPPLPSVTRTSRSRRSGSDGQLLVRGPLGGEHGGCLHPERGVRPAPVVVLPPV